MKRPSGFFMLAAALLSACTSEGRLQPTSTPGSIPDPEPTVIAGVFIDLPRGWRIGPPSWKLENGEAVEDPSRWGAERILLPGEPTPSIEPGRDEDLYGGEKTGVSFDFWTGVDEAHFGPPLPVPPDDSPPYSTVASKAEPARVGRYTGVTGTYHAGPAWDPMRIVGVYWFLPDARLAIDFHCERPLRLSMDQLKCARGLAELRTALDDVFVFPAGSLRGGRPTSTPG